MGGSNNKTATTVAAAPSPRGGGASDFREHLYAELAKGFINFSAGLSVADAIAASIIAVLLIGHAETQNLAVWAVLIWGISALRGILWQRERDSNLADEASVSGPLGHLAALAVAAGLWASAITFLWPLSSPLFQFILVLLIAGYAMTVTIGLSCYPLAANIYVLIVTPLSIYGMVNHFPSQVLLIAGTTTVLAFLSLGISSRFYRLTRDNIKLEHQLASAGEAAQSASLAKSQFIANMSHELRTPLNAILGFSEIIRDQTFGPLSEQKYLQYASDIHDSGSHLLDVINDILDLSKVEAGKMVLADTRIDLRRMVASSINLVRNTADDSGVKLEVQIASNVSHILADERAIRQILLNLLSNAIKFTPLGGEVTVEAKMALSGDIAIIVKDDGIGMAPDQLPMALEPFGQVDASMSRRFEGTGLGLPLVKSLTELHGGQLRLQSELGVGTTVIVQLPANRLSTDQSEFTKIEPYEAQKQAV